MTRTQRRQLCLHGMIGAASFWGPDILVQAYAGRTFSGKHVLVLTLLMPMFTMISLLLLGKTSSSQQQRFIAPSMMAGIWLLGGLAMAIGWSFAGGGFAPKD